MISAPPYRSPVQRLLELDIHVPLKAPLVSLHSARDILRANSDQILYWIDEGLLRWAFDLRGKNSDSAFVCILSRCIGEKNKGIKNTEPDDSIDGVLEEIWPRSRPGKRATELALDWSCGVDHLTNLIKADLLEVFPKEYQVNESKIILRESGVRFLKERVM